MNEQISIDFDLCTRKHKGNANSIAAHESIKESKRVIHSRILAELRAAPSGLSYEEIAIRCGLRLPSASARISELKALGEIAQSGKRPTSSGRLGAVYVARSAA